MIAGGVTGAFVPVAGLMIAAAGGLTALIGVDRMMSGDKLKKQEEKTIKTYQESQKVKNQSSEQEKTMD